MGSSLLAADGNNNTQQADRANDELHKIALVIGNSSYVNASILPNASNDAADMCAMLKKLNFDVICKLNIPSKRDFKDAIYEFTGNINEKSVVFFYFAGHGLQIDGINYLIPTRAALKTKSDIDDESIQINYLMSELEARQAALNIFILDACRNNPFINPIRGYVPAVGLASQLYAPKNSIIAMSTGPGKLSLDGTGRNGIFTKNILKFMTVPKQSIEDMLKAASGGTRSEAMSLGRQQDPQITSSYTEKYCLTGCFDQQSVKKDGDPSEQLKARQLELERLQTSIVQTKEKQAELEKQKNELLRKQGEINEIKMNLEKSEAQQEVLSKKKVELENKQKQLDEVNADIHSYEFKMNELEASKKALLSKQNELNAMRERLSSQQADIEAKKKEIQSRTIEPPKKEKKQPIMIPAF